MLGLSDDVDTFAEDGGAPDALSLGAQEAERTDPDSAWVGHAATPQLGLTASLDTSIHLSDQDFRAGLEVGMKFGDPQRRVGGHQGAGPAPGNK